MQLVSQAVVGVRKGQVASHRLKLVKVSGENNMNNMNNSATAALTLIASGTLSQELAQELARQVLGGASPVAAPFPAPPPAPPAPIMPVLPKRTFSAHPPPPRRGKVAPAPEPRSLPRLLVRTSNRERFIINFLQKNNNVAITGPDDTYRDKYYRDGTYFGNMHTHPSIEGLNWSYKIVNSTLSSLEEKGFIVRKAGKVYLIAIPD